MSILCAPSYNSFITPEHTGAPADGIFGYYQQAWGSGQDFVDTGPTVAQRSSLLDAFPSPHIPLHAYHEPSELQDIKAERCNAFAKITAGPPLVQGKCSRLSAEALCDSTSLSSGITTLSSQLFDDVDKFVPQYQGGQQAKPFEFALEGIAHNSTHGSRRSSSRSGPNSCLVGYNLSPLAVSSLVAPTGPNSSQASQKSSDSGRRYTQCPDCKRHIISQNLSRHRHKLHTPQRWLPYKCGTCSKSFDSPKDLSRHKTTHFDQKPFACTFEVDAVECGQQFKRKDNGYRHVRKAHQVQKKEAGQHIKRVVPEPERDW